jgi:hypothetical protein
MSRKTVNVEELLDFGNRQLERNDSIAGKEYKEGICTMIEKVLRLSDNYNGFMFLNNDDSEFDTLGYFSRKYFKKG